MEHLRSQRPFGPLSGLKAYLVAGVLGIKSPKRGPSTSSLRGAFVDPIEHLVAIAESAIESDAAGVTVEIQTGVDDSYMDTTEDDGVGCTMEIHSEGGGMDLEKEVQTWVPHLDEEAVVLTAQKLRECGVDTLDHLKCIETVGKQIFRYAHTLVKSERVKSCLLEIESAKVHTKSAAAEYEAASLLLLAIFNEDKGLLYGVREVKFAHQAREASLQAAQVTRMKHLVTMLPAMTSRLVLSVDLKLRFHAFVMKP
ncbi:hypothetical protein HPB52_017646 [Rhipicephalus sanguineus]|uniref:Uncharacterized protein n=1 Tax=Rhipicephalus sanguineus TaxID=34632 RepID=A0A9D4PK73_RHISA|nr:hypothetical protein HPB52_017646 [Rhipicephalus sanguineus]